MQAENNLATATGNISIGLVSLYRALGGGWQIREGKPFVDAATAQEMRARTNWGDLLPPTDQPQTRAPGPAVRAGRRVRASDCRNGERRSARHS